jgi:hypothetical protein
VPAPPQVGATKPVLGRFDVGEVGRVLLSSTMLGYDSALVAARKQMLTNNVNKNTIQGASSSEAVSSPTTIASSPDGEARRRRNKKKAKKKASAQGLGIAMSENVAKLKDEIKTETDRFVQLAGSDETVLRAHLEKLKDQNRTLQIETWRSLTAPVPLGDDARGPMPWVNLKETEYDSDSTSTTTTTTTTVVEELMLSRRPNAAKMYLKGREQEKVLSQAREAITRAANLCQFLADPKEPGALERRDVLIRAFRAITTDFSKLPDVDEKKPLF